MIDDYLQAEWGVSENNRRARFYRITAAGRRKLAEEKKSFDFLRQVGPVRCIAY